MALSCLIGYLHALGAPPVNVPPMFGFEKSAVISDGVCDIPYP